MGVETPDTAMGDAPQDEARERDRVWSVTRAGPLTPLALARKRLARGWRLLVFAGLGMLVAVVLICSVPLYASLVGNVQLQHVLTTAAPTATNISVAVTEIPLAKQGFDDVTQFATRNSTLLNGFAPKTASYLELEAQLAPLSVSPKTEKLPNVPNSVVDPLVFDYTTALPHMKILAGRLPKDAADGIPEVMVSSKMGLKVGDLLTIDDKVIAYKGNVLTTHKLIVRVVGVWFPKNLNDPYWNGRSYDSTPPLTGASKIGVPPSTSYPLLFSRNDFVTTFVPPAPKTTSAADLAALAGTRSAITLHFVYLTDPMAITIANADQVRGDIATFKDATQGLLTLEQGNAQGSSQPHAIIQGVTTGTQLDQLIASVQQQLHLLAQPLYIIVAQVVILALLFIVAMAALVVEAQGAELATLKSRGAGIVQLLTPYLLQGTALAVVAALVGPVLAAALSLAIVRAYLPGAGAGALTPGYLAQTIAPQSVTRPALAAAALGGVTLVLTAWRASRLDLLAFRREQGRSTRVALWRRLYLDLVLAAFCVLGYLELGEFGGLNVRAQLGQQQASASGAMAGADPFLLAAPALLLIAGALIVLRLFPLVARAGAALLSRGRGAPGLLAFAQVARGSAQFTRLALLLTLAMGLAIFALTFQASLGQNATQNAAFIVGSDQRVTLMSTFTFPPSQLLAKMQALPGVEAAMPAYRSSASTESGGVESVDVLGIDPTSFARVAYWRADYADQPLATLMGQMAAHAQGPNAGDRDHPFWALVDQTFAANDFLTLGSIFTLYPQEASDPTAKLYFRVGAVVNNIPTMTDPRASGNVLVSQQDYLTALANPNLIQDQTASPNEFWLRTTGNISDDARRANAIQTQVLPVVPGLDRRTLADELRTDPLNAGMSGLLLAGALIAALLAVLGSLVQAAVAARQRVTQFAILRTLGARTGQILALLLTQQVIVFCCGLVGGTLLGVVLATATLPFLQFSTAAANAAALRLPPDTLTFNVAPLAAFYGVLALAFVLALLVAARIATRAGLGKALRIGED